MPELAEVEYYRKRWAAGLNHRITQVRPHPAAKVFRNAPPALIARCLQGATLLSSFAAAKQMLFRFSGDNWLGIHLGMSGKLSVQPAGYVPLKHDHLVLEQAGRSLVFTDPRMFGLVLFHRGPDTPAWWRRIAPPILSGKFTVAAVAAFLLRRARAPLKAVLLLQERFPGVGNWMADEILWRAALHPQRPAGSLTPAETRTLWREVRRVCRLALDTIAGKGRYLPPDLNVHIPDTWLFNHRWEDGGRCPRTGVRLCRATVGGRTTCWSPARQKLR